ncbi:hypothetical protein bcgnr5372_39110 [Bacillus luti]|nr:hypothetical protein [Bacillus cereus]HDR8330461.1 hypothetical protein [Bacillus cereus]HDR8337494.1 hypothetical protein [Bacillus cereus]
MRTLDEIIEDNQEKLEYINVPKTYYNLLDYTHGRCHLFAQALHEELGYELEFLWDDEYWFEGDNAPSIVLVHAYCILPKGKPFKGKYVDARGGVSKRMIEREYEYNSKWYEKTTLEQLKETIKNKRLCKPDKGEIKAIRKFIRENINSYQ